MVRKRTHTTLRLRRLLSDPLTLMNVRKLRIVTHTPKNHALSQRSSRYISHSGPLRLHAAMDEYVENIWDTEREPTRKRAL